MNYCMPYATIINEHGEPKLFDDKTQLTVSLTKVKYFLNLKSILEKLDLLLSYVLGKEKSNTLF